MNATPPSALQEGSGTAGTCCAFDGLVGQFKALGHPVRMEIIRQLIGRDRCYCGDFCACLPLAQSTVSQHLDLLRKAGLVDYEPDGNRSRYSLNRAAFEALAQAMAELARTAAAQETADAAPDTMEAADG